MRSSNETRLAIGVAAASGLAILLFLMSTHLATHRYEVDFTPLLVFAAVAAIAIGRNRALTWRPASSSAIAPSPTWPSRWRGRMTTS